MTSDSSTAKQRIQGSVNFYPLEDAAISGFLDACFFCGKALDDAPMAFDDHVNQSDACRARFNAWIRTGEDCPEG